MRPKEPICALNIRRFPEDLRRKLRHFALDAKEDVQDFVPRWLRERLEAEENKIRNAPSKKSAKPKTG
jgi:hypothetical protein